MAHLFEHLMFGQTESLPPGEFDRLVERTGGESNAATWVDWTYYKLSLPARDLALGVRLEAERMQHLVLEPTPVEAERDVVTNERRERVEDDVDGWLDEQLMAHAFTVHPYRWPTIGWMEDIRALALPEIRAFYRTWYAPNNATIVCVGDFDDERAPRADREALRPHSRGAAARRAELHRAGADQGARDPRAEADRDRSLARRLQSARSGSSRLGRARDRVDAARRLSVGAAVSPLVIDQEAASSVDAQLTPFRDPSLLRLAVTTARGHGADEILAAIDREIAGLVEQPPPAAEVEKAKALAETDFWSGLADVDGKAEALGHYETALGDFRRLSTIAERLTAVTAADVARAVRTYLVPAHRTIVIAEPEDDDADSDDGDVDDGDS